jgi:hypothetical protein
LDETGPATNLHADGPMKFLHDPQLCAALDAVCKWTADGETLAVALASVVARNDATPATRPPTSMDRREIGDNLFLEEFFTKASLGDRRRMSLSIWLDFSIGNPDGVEVWYFFASAMHREQRRYAALCWAPSGTSPTSF